MDRALRVHHELVVRIWVSALMDMLDSSQISEHIASNQSVPIHPLDITTVTTDDNDNVICTNAYQ